MPRIAAVAADIPSAIVETPLLRASDIARLLGVTSRRVYQLVDAGLIPATRIGSSIVIPRAAWERWLADQAELALAHVNA